MSGRALPWRYDHNEASFSSAGFFHLRVPESSPVGSAVGRIRAHDLDVGRNAEVEYTIVPGDGGAMFDIATNEHNQEGVIILRRVNTGVSVVMNLTRHRAARHTAL